MFKLCSKIKIGPDDSGQTKIISGLCEVAIERSIYDAAATAKIVLPATAVIREEDQTPLHVRLSEYVKAGMPIEIYLGYNEEYNLEFRGFIENIDDNEKFEIKCTDYFLKTKSQNVTISGTKTVEEILELCGLDIGYATQLTISNLSFEDVPVSKVLNKIRDDYDLCVFFDFDNKVYVSEPFAEYGEGDMHQSIYYESKWNVIESENIKHKQKTEAEVTVRAICQLKNRTKIEAVVGNAEGQVKTLRLDDVHSQLELKSLVVKVYDKENFKGYRGTMETFLLPYAAPCMWASLEDGRYPERSGNYYIEGVTVTFGTRGGRRTIQLSRKV